MRLDTLKLEDRVGHEYAFDVYHREAAFTAAHGVYLVLREDAPGDYVTLYVGETDDLAGALDSHPRKACFDEHRANRVGLHPKSDPAVRQEIAAALVANYDPPCNE